MKGVLPPRSGRCAAFVWVLSAAWVMGLLVGAGAALAADVAPLADLETKMSELVNKDRAEHQKKPLERDERLAAVARAHSRDMMENRFFSHESPTKGAVARRLYAAKVRVMACGENISMSPSVEFSESSFMKSPGHKANILSEVFTHCGIGIVTAANGLLYVTQVFAAPAPDVDLASAQAEIIARVNKARIAQEKLPFKVSAGLNQVAARQAAVMADSGKPVVMDVSALARDVGVDARRLSVAHVSTWNPTELADAQILLKPRIGLIGMGFARNEKHEKLGYGIIWAVVIFTSE